MVSVVNLQTEQIGWVALAVAVGSVVLGRAVRAVTMRPGAPSMGSTNIGKLMIRWAAGVYGGWGSCGYGKAITK